MTFASELDRPARNPYAPPTALGLDPRTLPLLPRERFGEVDIRVTAIEPRMMRRRFVCENTADSDLVYDAWGSWLIGECVYVNGRLRTRNLGFGWGWEYVAWVSPRIDFLLEWRGSAVPARLETELKMTLFRGLRFKHLRLYVAERLICDES